MNNTMWISKALCWMLEVGQKKSTHHMNPFIYNSRTGTINPWCWESDRWGPGVGGRGMDDWGDLENFGGRWKCSIFDYGISYVGVNISQSLLHSKWLHFIVWKLYQNKLTVRNINDKPNHLLSVSIKVKSLKKRRFYGPNNLENSKCWVTYYFPLR